MYWDPFSILLAAFFIFVVLLCICMAVGQKIEDSQMNKKPKDK